MNYPDWAPSALVQLHREKLGYTPSASGFNPADPESLIESIVREQGGELSAEGVEILRQRLYRNSFVGLPPTESAEMLWRLISNGSMRSVWRSIEKHADGEHGAVEFFSACENAIAGWRGEAKRTRAERNGLLLRVQKLASELSLMLHDCPDFDYFSIANMIDDGHLKVIADGIASHEVDIPGYQLRVSPDENDYRYFRMSFSEAIPSVHKVLEEVGERAKKIAEQDVIVKKPGSTKSEVHYFVRWLSDYCRDQYSKPLHEVVAITASVVFDDNAIDSSYVAHLSSATSQR